MHSIRGKIHTDRLRQDYESKTGVLQQKHTQKTNTPAHSNSSHLRSFESSLSSLQSHICLKHNKTHKYAPDCVNTTHLKSTSASCTQRKRWWARQRSDTQEGHLVKHRAPLMLTMFQRGRIVQPEPCCHRSLRPNGTSRLCSCTFMVSFFVHFPRFRSLSCSNYRYPWLQNWPLAPLPPGQ